MGQHRKLGHFGEYAPSCPTLCLWRLSRSLLNQSWIVTTLAWDTGRSLKEEPSQSPEF